MGTRTVVAVLALLQAHTAAADAYCKGEYAEDLTALSPEARATEARVSPYSYAVRTSATYECVSYGSDGNLKKTRANVIAYGTAFGYRHDGADTLLLTNEHVAEWPAVTDDEHPVDGVANGCKRVSDSLKIVDDDHDDYAADDIALARVVVDPSLDVAVLRAHGKLEILPWRIGKSSALVARDVVEVRGFPLGEFRATNVGKVVSAYEHDDQGDWNHDDFIVDALLTAGGSGSPVLAVSCKTGELELVGIFHAHYTAASALNVVIAIDQVRDLVTTLKRTPRVLPVEELDAAARTKLASLIAHDPDPPYFSLGALPASVQVRADGTFIYTLFSADFPHTTRPVLVVEDLAGDGATSFGKLGSVTFGTEAGLVPFVSNDAEADSQALIAHALAMFRAGAFATFSYRAASQPAATTRAAFVMLDKQRRALVRMTEGQRDAVQGLVELAHAHK